VRQLDYKSKVNSEKGVIHMTRKALLTYRRNLPTAQQFLLIMCIPTKQRIQNSLFAKLKPYILTSKPTQVKVAKSSRHPAVDDWPMMTIRSIGQVRLACRFR
jgi:hypothetical protein